MRYHAWTLLALGLAVASSCGRADETPIADPHAGMPGMEMRADTGAIALQRAEAARLGVRFARASVRPVRGSIRLAGALTYAEPRRIYVSARVGGWVEELHADYEGMPVRAGDPLLSLYAPELVSAQEEYLAARRLGDSALVAASRRRLELWNIPEDEIAALEERGTAARRILLRAPVRGEIAEKLVVNGQSVRSGDNLFLIANRDVLWVEVAVFEMDARAVRVGTPVSVKVDALGDRRYPGQVTFVFPSLDEKTRTLTARVEVSNRDGQLRPGMYGTVEVAPSATTGLSVPVDAVLPTGTRMLVFVNRGDGLFEPREVITGARGDSLVEIVRGLKAGDEVIAAATYLLDSESNLAAAMQGLMLQMGMGLDMGGMPAPPPPRPGDSARRLTPATPDSGRRTP